MAEIRFENEQALMDNFLESAAFKQFITEQLQPKIDREEHAWKLLLEHRGQFKEDTLNLIFDEVDGGNKRWFGSLLAKPNRNLIFATPPALINQWIEQLLFSNSKPEIVLNTCLKELRIKGASKGLATLLLYLSAPDKYGIWVNATEKGLSVLGRIGELRGTAGAQNYAEFNKGVAEFRSQYSLRSQEIDWILTFIGKYAKNENSHFIINEDALESGKVAISTEQEEDSQCPPIAGTEYTWIPFFAELAQTLLGFEKRQAELVSMLRDAGLTAGLADQDRDEKKFPLEEIDPFTFMAQILKFGSDKRQGLVEQLKTRLGIAAALPEDFLGLPGADPRLWFFSYKAERSPTDIPQLWEFSRQVVGDSVTAEVFAQTLHLKQIGKAKLTQGMFWLRPDKYLPIDGQTRPYLEKAGIDPNFSDYAGYQRILTEVMTKFFGKQYYEISHEAWQENQVKTPPSGTKYWLYAPGREAQYWEEFHEKGIMAIGWDYLGDLAQYPNKAAIAEAIREHDHDPSSKINNAATCYSFVRGIQVGDYVFAKQGRERILGYGEVESDCQFDDTRGKYKHVRKMKWISKGDWKVGQDSRFALKTLTDITKFEDFVDKLKTIVKVAPPQPAGGENGDTHAYWWLNANPKIWNIEETPVGQKQTYTSRNEKGNKRQKYKYFQEVKPGDIVVGYVTSPQKEVVAVCKITEGLHKTKDREVIEFEKIEQLATPITYETLRSNQNLAGSEPLINNQGSLFRLTEQEYEAIRSIIDEINIPAPTPIQPYTKKEAMEDRVLSASVHEGGPW